MADHDARRWAPKRIGLRQFTVSATPARASRRLHLHASA